MKNWLEIAVGIYLLGMVLYGHHRGLVRLAVSMAALSVTLITVKLVMPYAAAFIRDNTPVQAWIVDRVEDAFEESGLQGIPDMQPPAAQREFIEKLGLPSQLESLLIENNNNEVYRSLGVEAFAGYIGSYLSNVMINSMSFVVLFVAVYAALKLLASALDIVSKLPVISSVNKLAGALLGGVEALFFLWLAALVVTAFGAFPWAAAVLEQIRESVWLSFLYRYNLITWLVLGIVKGMTV